MNKMENTKFSNDRKAVFQPPVIFEFRKKDIVKKNSLS